MTSDLNSLNANEFSARVLKSDRPVLVEFGAPWCGPCKMLEPVLSELAEQYAGKIDFYSLNIDDSPELVMEYGIMGVPTVMLFEGGQPQERLTGYRPKHALEKVFFSND